MRLRRDDMEISTLMHAAVEAAPTDTTFRAAELMRDLGIGCLVVSDGSRLVGIITDRDLTVRCSAAGHDPMTCVVETHMSTGLATARADGDVLDALHLMLTHKVRRLPVVDDTRLVGLISLSDVAAALDGPIHDLLGGIGAVRHEAVARPM